MPFDLIAAAAAGAAAAASAAPIASISVSTLDVLADMSEWYRRKGCSVPSALLQDAGDGVKTRVRLPICSSSLNRCAFECGI